MTPMNVTFAGGLAGLVGAVGILTIIVPHSWPGWSRTSTGVPRPLGF